MSHDAEEKLVTVEVIFATAKQALAKKFPGCKYEEMDREELVAILQIKGMQALDEHIEALETQMESLIGAAESKVDAAESKVDAVESKVEKMTQELSEIKTLLHRLLKKANL